MLGISVHTLVEAQSAERLKADFVILGNVYETESHPGKPGVGLDLLAHIVENTILPVIAIGGITAERVNEVLAAGASGVAVIRAVSRADDPELAARGLREALDAADYPHLR
jgi:thiamine-phosphate pyrophosphorylase